MRARVYLPLTPYQLDKFKEKIARGWTLVRYQEGGVEKLIMHAPSRARTTLQRPDEPHNVGERDTK